MPRRVSFNLLAKMNNGFSSTATIPLPDSQHKEGEYVAADSHRSHSTVAHGRQVDDGPPEGMEDMREAGLAMVTGLRNYGKELFLKENTGTAFERALMETVERCGWKLHAYVMMSHLIQNKA